MSIPHDSTFRRIPSGTTWHHTRSSYHEPPAGPWQSSLPASLFSPYPAAFLPSTAAKRLKHSVMILLGSSMNTHSRLFKQGTHYGIWLQRLLIARTKAMWQKLPGAWLEEGRVAGRRGCLFFSQEQPVLLVGRNCYQAKESGKCSFQAPVASVWGWEGRVKKRACECDID